MKLIGILLILVSIMCFAASTIGFGDIGLAFAAISLVSLLSGIGFLKMNKKLKSIS